MAVGAILVLWAGCYPDFGLDGYLYKCNGDGDCGEGLRCIGTVCVASADGDTSGTLDTTAPADIEDSSTQSLDVTACDGHDVCAVPPMADVPAGTFSMGSKESEAGRRADEHSHEVQLSSPFQVDRYEVTNAAYLLCVQAKECASPTLCDSGQSVWTGPEELAPALRDEPVRCVSWSMARDYCQFVSKRLCTEAEWERACIGTEVHRVYPWGDLWPSSPSIYANCDDADCHNSYGDGTTVVGSFGDGQVPELGILDMAGNVGEWVLDFYDEDTYLTGLPTDPKGPCGGAEPCEGCSAGSCPARVYRGGSYESSMSFLRCASRGGALPTSHRLDIGIRCCSEAEQ